MNIREAALKAIDIYNEHQEGARLDAGFDGGEFSGPAHDRMAEKEVREMCKKEGVPYEEVNAEMHLME